MAGQDHTLFLDKKTWLLDDSCVYGIFVLLIVYQLALGPESR